LKEGNQWELDFEALEKLDLTRKIMWIGIHTQQELEGV
jgi:hypothetical protein